MLLRKLLSQALSPVRRRPATNPDYTAFRKAVRRYQLVYRITHDQFIEIEPCAALPLGLTTAHHGWRETLDRLEHCIENPDAIGVGGHFAE